MNISSIPQAATAAEVIAELEARPTLRRTEVADLYGVSESTVNRAIRAGELAVLRIGRNVLIARPAHRAWSGVATVDSAAA